MLISIKYRRLPSGDGSGRALALSKWLHPAAVGGQRGAREVGGVASTRRTSSSVMPASGREKLRVHRRFFKDLDTADGIAAAA
jgi:hypothetical protein